MTLFQLRKYSGRNVSIEDTLSQQFLVDRNYNNNDEVYRTNSIKVNGVAFRVRLYVCLESSRLRADNLPLFAKIDEIILLNDIDVYFLISVYTIVSFDTMLHAYHLEFHADLITQLFVNVSSLAYYKPFSCWNKAHCDNLYMSLRHYIL